MSLIDRVKEHHNAQINSCIEVPEWGDEDQPLKIFYDPPTLKETFAFNSKADNNYQLMLCHMIVRKARDEDGNSLFKESDAQALYTNADERVVARIGLQMKNHLSVADQVKN